MNISYTYQEAFAGSLKYFNGDELAAQRSGFFYSMPALLEPKLDGVANDVGIISNDVSELLSECQIVYDVERVSKEIALKRRICGVVQGLRDELENTRKVFGMYPYMVFADGLSPTKVKKWNEEFSLSFDRVKRLRADVAKSRSDKSKSYVDSVVNGLEAFSGEVHCPKLARAIDAWLEKCAREALEANDKGVDFFCRRSAVIGYKAGLLAYVLEGEKETMTVCEFATWVAERVMRNQIRLWGDLVEEQLEIASASGHKQNLYEKMPPVFSRNELKSAMKGCNNVYVRQIICRWKKARMIEDAPEGKFIKVTPSKPA